MVARPLVTDLLPTSIAPGLSRFVGRDREQLELARWLDQCEPVITVFGPAGAGKTRLALEVVAAHRQSSSRPRAVADLGARRDLSGACAVLARALGLPLETEGEARLDELGDRFASLPPCVVVLDGVGEAAALLVARLAREAPRGVSLLVTAPVRLGLDGERTIRLGGLTLPPAEGDDPRAYAACQLFEDRAASVRAGYRIAEDAPSVAELCRLLDGMPRGIELAALRMNTMTAPQLLGRLRARGASVLGPDAGDPSWPWAYELLDTDERRVLIECTTFHDGFTLEAAEEVLGEEGAGLLQALADRSLIEVAFPPPGEPRFHVLHSIGRWLSGRDEAAARCAPCAARHARHYHRLAREGLSRFDTADAVAAGLLLARESANLRAAADRLPDDEAAECHLAAATVAAARGIGADAVRQATLGLGRLGPATLVLLDGSPPPPSADDAPKRARIAVQLLLVRGRVQLRRMERVEARQDLRAAVDLSEGVTPAELHARALLWLAIAEDIESSAASARELHARARTVASSASAATRAEIDSWCFLGIDDAAACLPTLDAAIATLLREGQPRALLTARRNHGHLLLAAGQHGAARAAFWAARGLAEELEDPVALGVINLYLGMVEAERGEHRVATDCYLRSLQALQHRCYDSVEVVSLALLSASLLALGDPEAALPHLARARKRCPHDALRTMIMVETVECAVLVAAGRRERAEACALRVRELARSAPPEHRDALLQTHAVAEAFLLGTPVPGPADAIRDLPGMTAMVAALRRAAANLAAAAGRCVLRVTDGEFVLGHGAPVDLTTRGAMRRVLHHLARLAIAAPGELSPVDVVFEAGWPGERAIPRAAARRVYTCVWGLRRLGLGDVLEREEGGYRLATAIMVVMDTSPGESHRA